MFRSSRHQLTEEPGEFLALSGVRQEAEIESSLLSIPGSNRETQGNQREHWREHHPQLLESDLETLSDVGTFRTLALQDIARYRFRNDINDAKKHFEAMARQGLIQSRTSYPDRCIYVTLTRDGHRLASQALADQNPTQKLYRGFVKTRQAQHDAALFRLYQQEAARIHKAGGKIRRVVLDFELQETVNRRLANVKSLSPQDLTNEKNKIAQEHGLTVVQGKIPLPDLRLEYEGPDQQITKVDLELVTSHYHRGTLATKAKAGFAMYAFAENAARLRTAMEDPEIMQDIFSL
jgi:DNA-binding MarR family transcriptional regulator